MPSPAAHTATDRLTLLLESTGEGIFGIDMDGVCTFMNRAGAQMLGRRTDMVLGRNMHALIHHSHCDGRHYPEADCPIFNAFRQGLPCRIDDEVLWRADGSSFWAEYSSYPIIDDGVVQGAVVTFVDISERKRAAEVLRQAHTELEARVAERTRELRDLANHLEAVRESERTRIAREIHDELGSLLVALKMDTHWLGRRVEGRPELQAKCQGMGRLIDTAVDNVGRIITDLRPSILDHQGLWAALEWQAQEFTASAELVLDWQLALDESLKESTDVPEPLAMAVFRIFQEMLSNVGRHARAQRLQVQIALQAGVLTLAVQDDGQGAPAQAFEAADAYGVMGMRERAHHFGGRIDISSAPGAGTRMCLSVALPSETSA